MAAGCVFTYIRARRYLLIVIAAQIAGTWLLGQGSVGSLMPPLSPEEVTGRIGAYGATITFTLLFGYVFFIDFITGEGTKHLRLRAEMALAERTHRFLVPPVDLRADHLEVYGQSRASSQVGGDLLDATEHDGKTLVYVADVSGHSVAAGTLMSLTKGAVRARLLAGVPLSKLVSDLNRVLIELSSPNMFVTFAAIRLDGDGEGEACLAGHLPILHYRPETARVSRLPNESVPLGILADAVFRTTTVSCRRGDLFAILTDGLTEVEDQSGRELGVEGVEKLMPEVGDRSLAEIHDAVMRAVARHGPQRDDQTLLLVRVR
jgi:sigma-B regulation protein RsbU (phosphoserine phosphatase)